MTTFPVQADDRDASASRLRRALVLAVALAAAADWLFYGHTIGLSYAIFILCLIACTVASNPPVFRGTATRRPAAVLISALLPSVIDTNIASVICGLAGTALVAIMIAAPSRTGLQDRLAAIRSLILTGPFRLLPDLARSGHGVFNASMAVAWLVPLFLGAVFLALFASANPMIEHWLRAIDLGGGVSRISPLRALFWLAVLSFVWPFVCMKLTFARQKDDRSTEEETTETSPVTVETPPPSQLLGATAVFRSLVLFNLLFAVQTVLDLIYLWGGVTLPNGLTYATYAHRGAYPLIVTALLAAGFILRACVVEQTPQRKRLVDWLIVVWTLQNLLLVLSSILRLDRYVEAYSLTYWRVAAFIWMALVATGLVFILLRLVLRRSEGWLIRMNLIALASVLYLCTCVNFAAIVADYNVTDSRDMGGKGPALDTDYLIGLGPQAIPAIDRLVARRPDYAQTFAQSRAALAGRQRRELNSWRGWSIRGWRLLRYLNDVDAPRPVVQER